MTIKDVTTISKKYLTKQVMIIGLVVLAAGSMYTSCNTRAKLSAVRSELSSSQMLNTLAGVEKARLNSLITIYKDSIQKRDVIITAKDKKINKQLGEISSLRDSITHNLANVGNVTADSSYKYVNNRVPAKSERKFPFDSVQVKAIHYTFIERDGLFSLNNKLNLVVVDLRQSSSIKDNQITDLNSLVNVYISKDVLCKLENDSYKIRIEGLSKDVTKQKRLKNILVVPAAVGILAVAIKLLAK
jgi:hypothetical protein